MTATTYIALTLVGILLLTMPVFAIVSRSRPMDADVARRPTTALLGYWVRDWVMWVIAPLERAMVAWRVSPDLFNYLGVAFGVFAAVAYARHSLAAAGWMVLLGGLADIMDGRIARARGLASAYGEFLDSMLDRFSEAFVFVGLAFVFEGSALAAAGLLLAIGGSMMVSYARAKGAVVGVDCRGGVMQRAERLVIVAVASLVDGPITSALGWRPGMVLLAAVWVVGVGSLGTAVYRTAYIARALRKRERVAP